MTEPRITLIGGPTALIEIGGFRFLTDPTLDDPGEYRLPHVTLIKTSRPAIGPSEIGPLDACCSQSRPACRQSRHVGPGISEQCSARLHHDGWGVKRLGGRAVGVAP